MLGAVALLPAFRRARLAGALAEVEGERLILRAVSFLNDTVQRSELTSKVREPAALGEAMAAELGA